MPADMSRHGLLMLFTHARRHAESTGKLTLANISIGTNEPQSKLQDEKF